MVSNSVRYILCVLTLLASGSTASAQEQTRGLYNAWVYQTSQVKSKGILYNVRDSSVVLTASFDPKSLSLSQDYQRFYVNKISKIKLRRKGKLKSGLLIGFFCGAAPGAVIGFNINKNIADGPHHGARDAFIGGLFGGAIGMVVGTLIGIAKLKIPINGSQGWFDANRGVLWSRSYRGRKSKNIP